MTEYTPTVEEVRGAYAKWVADPEWFDRMIAAVERAAAVKALREAADVMNQMSMRGEGTLAQRHAVIDMADRIESGEQA